MTTGSALLMWIGEQITEKGVGNGISIVLLFNILSSVPDDMKTLYYRFIFGQTVTKMIFSVVVIDVYKRQVKVMETRPLSKDKRWRLVEIIEKAR